MRNCHEDLPKEEKEDLLSNCMKSLQNLGYKKEYRTEILKSAFNGHKKTQKEAEERHETPMYRPKGYWKMERILEKKAKKKTWFKKGDCDSYIMIPATPNSELKKEVDQIAKNSGLKIKVVERPGKKLVDLYSVCL